MIAKKKRLKNIITFSIIGALLIGVLSALLLIKPSEKQKIDSSYFVVGKLNSDGEFLESDDYLVTKNYIACDGLTITPDYNATTKYQVFFYDIDRQFIRKTEEMTGAYRNIDTVPYVEFCKIMLIPDMEGKTYGEFKIKNLNKSSYVDEFKITIDKTQTESEFKNQYSNFEILSDTSYDMATGYKYNSSYNATNEVIIPSSCKTIYILYKSNVKLSALTIDLLNNDNSVRRINQSSNFETKFGMDYDVVKIDIVDLEKYHSTNINKIILHFTKDVEFILYSDVELIYE